MEVTSFWEVAQGERLSSVRLARETVRKILLRRKDLVIDLQQAERKRPERISIRKPLRLWGVDLTLVWVLSFIPVWVLGVVDYSGSRLVIMERVLVPTSAEVQRVLRRAFAAHGIPARILTDNGSQFTSLNFELMLSAYDIEHTKTMPAHPWTNGRIERLFRTFKEAIDRGRWMIATVAQLDRFCEDFLVFYNRDRPHSAWGGRTPDEVYFGRAKQLAPLGRVSYFDGVLSWYRFG